MYAIRVLSLLEMDIGPEPKASEYGMAVLEVSDLSYYYAGPKHIVLELDMHNVYIFTTRRSLNLEISKVWRDLACPVHPLPLYYFVFQGEKIYQ